ncbi:MAG: methyltransferase [Desulfobacter sp.]|nr:methyltransferase [Desulfobacter sp.]WDP85907.1 MAG: methyltransferase [Desulfobacter sp.]
MEKFTVESFFNGQLRLTQPKTGYRYTIDPVILCSQIIPLPGSKILDIGCGCGIMELILGFRYPQTLILGVEIQEALAVIAQKNVLENHMEKQISIIHKNISHVSGIETKGPVDLIIANPPYQKAGTGRLPPIDQRAIARHEVKLNIHALFAKAEELLKPGGKLMLIFPADRLVDLTCAMDDTAIRPEWFRFVHTRHGQDAKRVIFSGVKNTGPSCRVLAPLHLYDKKNKPTKTYHALFNP